MKKYETTIVLDAGVDNSVIDSEIGNVESTITANGGKILGVERWGVRRFAYELKKRHQGNYIHIKFEGPGGIPEQLNRHYRINERILRFMTVVSVDVGGMAGALESIKAEEKFSDVAEISTIDIEETVLTGELDVEVATELPDATPESDQGHRDFRSGQD